MARRQDVPARRAVRLSLVQHHFGSRQDLLIAVLEHENELLLERQRAFQAASVPLADTWCAACGFLDEDVSSGEVRVLWELWELWAAALTDDKRAAGWRVHGDDARHDPERQQDFKLGTLSASE